jgi:hypothetical protein
MDKGLDNHEEEVRSINISLGNEKIESNGYTHSMDSLELVENIRSLNMEVHSFRADNERLLNSLEKKNQLNTNLLQILNQLQRQINNGSSSRLKEEIISCKE